jgi:hypothetical protein
MKARAAIAVGGLAFTSLFFIDLCNFVFACGCASLWSGADAHCNVHAAAGIHCPVCTLGAIGYAVTFGAIALPQIATALLLKRGPWCVRLGIVILLFPLIGSAVMTVVGRMAGYPINRVVFWAVLE